ncbi:MAG: TRAP transporter small permease [Alphaproteobacteria bacterium]|nr:TRAP transporter small permease [Alphaproteobacteria bacterium]
MIEAPEPQADDAPEARRNVLDLCAKLLEYAALLLLAATCITVFLQVVFRYVIGIAVPWTEELARYLCVWMVFLGAAAVAARDEHIKVLFLLDRLTPRGRDALLLATFALCAAFDVIVLLGSIRLVQLNWGQLATTLPVSVGVLYLSLLLFASFSLLFFMRLILRKAASLRTRG